jgi:2-oxoglutarate ferredoxin oxidoreductase subunit beta
VKGTTELMKLAIRHHGFAFLNIISPCVTWRGDHQTKELRAKLAAIPADHDRSDRTAALRFTSENAHLTTGVLYETQRPTLIDEMMEIREKAVGQAPPPGREEILRVFAPAR